MSELIKHRKMAVWGLRFAGLLVGACIAWLVYLGGQIDMMSRLSGVYQRVGVTLIALMPLALWAVYTAFRAGHNSDITLAYIGTTAQRVGLLGTVIGIVAATITIGDNLNTGAATAVTGALPAVGQALVSTAVGFVIAIVCDFFRYINARGTVPGEV
jgi:MotA/TolQ/ExbB proton channel family